MYMRNEAASEVNAAFDSLPVAQELPLSYFSSSDEPSIPVTSHKAIVVEKEVVACPSKDYVLVQHKEAFRPIIEGLTQAGKHDFKFSLWANHRRAFFDVLTSSGYDSVSYGFRVTNSFDAHSAIKYALESKYKGQPTLELVGYRQVCSNGMKIEVPLNEAEFVRLEERTKVMQLLRERAVINHMGDVKQKIESVQYVVEAMTVLQAPIERYIRKAQSWNVGDSLKVKQLIKAHVGKRLFDRVHSRFNLDNGKSLWDLYNAITYVASHDKLSEVTNNSLIDRASAMLNEVMIPRAVQGVEA
jgi:hypothetical protein